MPFMRVLFGMTMMSPEPVSRVVCRQRISRTTPSAAPARMRSPGANELSKCRTIPPMTLPKVSCKEKATTAVSMAEVAKIPVRLAPSWEATVSAAQP